MMDWAEAAAILGFSPEQALGLTPQGLGVRFKKAMKEHHPDHGGSEEKTKRINAAREVLRDWIKAGKPIPPPAQPEPEPTPPFTEQKGTGPGFGGVAVAAVIGLGVLGFAALQNVNHTQAGIVATAPVRYEPAVSKYEPALIVNRPPAAKRQCIRDYDNRCIENVWDPWINGYRAQRYDP